MTIDEVYKYFRSWNRVSKVAGFAINTPRNWRRIGHIPALAQIRLEKFTDGVLKFRMEDLGAPHDVDGK